jgi:integrase/recombinase XerC
VLSAADQRLAEFRTALERQGRSHNTIESYTSDIRMYLLFCAEHGEDEDSAPRWIDHLRDTAATSTVLRRMASLRCFYELMLDKKVLQKYSAPSVAPGYAHPLPNGMDDVRDMIRLCQKEPHRHLVTLCAFAGVRVSESRFILRRHITQDDVGQWWVHVVGKGRKERDVPLVDEAIGYLNLDVPLDRRMVQLQDRQARQIIQDLGERAGISRIVSSHDLRMTFGTTIYAKTLDLRVTQDLLGHSSSETTTRYTGRDNDDKINAVRGSL